MNLRFSSRFVTVTMLSVAALHAQAPAADPVATLRGAIDEVMAVAYDTQTATPLVERVRPVLAKYFNFESITRRAVGPGWRQFTPEHKERTTRLFTELVLRTYANRFEAGDRPGITYGKPVMLDPARPALRELPTTIDYAGKKYAVSYRMEQMNGSWLIYDVNIEGVSMVANWRAQLDPIFQRGGATAVMESLDKNLSREPIK
jgi:phospholipid transport system substrate-binding protein